MKLLTALFFLYLLNYVRGEFLCSRNITTFNVSLEEEIIVKYSPEPYPRGLTGACFYHKIGKERKEITISYDTQISKVDFPYISKTNSYATPECYPNRFPFRPFQLQADQSCIGAIPWCSSELWMNFWMVFSAEGYQDKRIYINCSGGN